MPASAPSRAFKNAAAFATHLTAGRKQWQSVVVVDDAKITLDN